MCYQKRDRQLAKEKFTETKCVIRRETDNWQKKKRKKSTNNNSQNTM